MGIEIVENLPRSAAAQFQITVDTLPAVDIGRRDGPAEYLLAGVVGAMRLRDGRIVVVERDAHFRYFSHSGIHDTTVVRTGEGPGEVTRISRFFPYRGDSLLVLWGGAGERTAAGASSWVEATVFDGNGKYGRHTQLRLTDSGAGAVTMGIEIEGIAPDGRFVVRRAGSPALAGSPGIRWAREPYVLLAADGSQDTIAVLPNMDVQENVPSGRGGSQAIVPFFPPQGAYTSAA